MSNTINNVLACSVLFLSTTGLFPARRKNFRAREAVECSNVFLSAHRWPSEFESVGADWNVRGL